MYDKKASMLQLLALWGIHCVFVRTTQKAPRVSGMLLKTSMYNYVHTHVRVSPEIVEIDKLAHKYI